MGGGGDDKPLAVDEAGEGSAAPPTPQCSAADPGEQPAENVPSTDVPPPALSDDAAAGDAPADAATLSPTTPSASGAAVSAGGSTAEVTMESQAQAGSEDSPSGPAAAGAQPALEINAPDAPPAAIGDSVPGESAAAEGAAMSAAAPAAEAPPADAAQRRSELDDDLFPLRTIRHNGRECKIVMQLVNGPCPLIAICNVLLLEGRMTLPAEQEIVTFDHLVTQLCEYIWSTEALYSGEQLSAFQQSVSATMECMPKLKKGLDVNLRFTGVDAYEYTEEISVFDSARVSLFHGWVIDPQSDLSSVIGDKSYNQLIELVANSFAEDASEQTRMDGIRIRSWLEDNMSQMTIHGLTELYNRLPEQRPCVLFRNNHFGVIMKDQGSLFYLVTDDSFRETPVVWESVSGLDGDCLFFDEGRHRLREDQLGYSQAPAAELPEADQDYQLALALQMQENQQQQQQGHRAAPSGAPQYPSAPHQHTALPAQQHYAAQHQQHYPQYAAQPQRHQPAAAYPAATQFQSQAQSDEQLARQLQQEEERALERERVVRQAQQQMAPPPQQQPKKDKDSCDLM